MQSAYWGQETLWITSAAEACADIIGYKCSMPMALKCLYGTVHRCTVYTKEQAAVHVACRKGTELRIHMYVLI